MSRRAPLIQISPEVGCSNPAMRRRSVVLPEPLSPSRVRNSPEAICREMFFRTARAPKCLAMLRTSSRVAPGAGGRRGAG